MTSTQSFYDRQAAIAREEKLAALAACPIQIGMTVTRSGKSKPQGTVVGRFAELNRRICTHIAYRVVCRVEWDGAANGAQRFGGGAWNTTSTVLASSLKVAK